MHGNIVRLKFAQKHFQHRASAGLAKHPFETNQHFIGLNYVQACSIIAMYTGFKTWDTTTMTAVEQQMKDSLRCARKSMTKCFCVEEQIPLKISIQIWALPMNVILIKGLNKFRDERSDSFNLQLACLCNSSFYECQI